jgi:hypothetical protein
MQKKKETNIHSLQLVTEQPDTNISDNTMEMGVFK